jgi:hypothetical protein
MNEEKQLTQPQRKALADMLKEWGNVWRRAEKQYETARTLRKEAIIGEAAGDGIVKAKDGILSLRGKLQAAEDELKQLGFEVDYEGALDLASSSSRVAKSIEKRLDAEVGTKDDVLNRRFETARIKLLLVASAEEAEKIVESLLDFEVAVK